MKLPVNAAAVTMIATGKVRPVRQYAELTDGSRRPVPDSQETDEGSGLPLWQVDTMVDLDEENENGRSDVSAVKVPAKEQPKPSKFAPINFEGLTATPYVSGGWVQISWRATGIATATTGKAAS